MISTRFVLRAILVLGVLSASGVLAAPTSSSMPHSTEVQALQSSGSPIVGRAVPVNVLETRGAVVSIIKDNLEDWNLKSVQQKLEALDEAVKKLKVAVDSSNLEKKPTTVDSLQNIVDGYEEVLGKMKELESTSSGLGQDWQERRTAVEAAIGGLKEAQAKLRRKIEAERP
ncbi:hypothetical protein F5878DRAFT_631499 [Lentinula raphanica]|uniref:Uncharacterized protein n=1 Tax=Lentinula raphanica TaxID=153919 RepID=A0AA38P0W1_9AGAR|nr:hypothetical protein F5878DRAFT_631499 [Lentinula raphanica]